MSFQEKSTWIMLGTMVLVYGWYFTSIASELGAGGAADISYRGAMLATVLALVVLAVVGHIVVAIADPKGSDVSDERDRVIDRQGEYIGGFVLGAGVLGALALAMFEIEHFWIANLLLLALVLSEVTALATKVILYRRGV